MTLLKHYTLPPALPPSAAATDACPPWLGDQWQKVELVILNHAAVVEEGSTENH